MALDLRMQAGPHVFVDDLERPELREADRHHLARALRVRSGDPLTLSDGAGNWRTARFGDVVQPDGVVQAVAPPAYEIGIGVALTKAAKPEFAVQKATEIGVDRIVVFEAEHSVARWDEPKRSRNEQRLATVAREAAMQSRRVTIPTVEVVENLDHMIGLSGVARADFGGSAVHSGHRFVLVGPEGGWSATERQRLPEAIDLGPTVLRAETAAIVASTILVMSRDQK